MATYSDDQKYNALQLLHQEKSNTEVAKELGIPIATIVRWGKELKEAKLNGGIDSLVDMDRVVLGELVEQLPDDLKAAGNELVAKTDSLQRLSVELHNTAKHLTTRVKVLAATADSSSELIALSEVLCNMQNAFFNSNTTQVNVQNNYGQSSYSEFLSDAPAE